MIQLSYSAIANCLQENNSHAWINRVMKLPAYESDAMRNGKRLHRIIQDHFSGKIPREDLSHIPYKFEIVEEKEKDERTHFEIQINTDFTFHGYNDGKCMFPPALLEIKTGSKMWSIRDFLFSEQIACYCYANPFASEIICVTALADENMWKVKQPKFYKIENTREIREKGMNYIYNAIHVFNTSKFKGGLIENVCQGCSWGKSCYFAKNVQN